MKIIALALAASAAASGVRFPEMSYDAGWSRSSAPLDKPVSFAFHVRQQNLPRLMQIALDVSTPSHPKYGHFLKQAEIDTLTAPAAADVRAVMEWLAQHPAVSCTTDREVISCRGTAAAAARLLRTHFFTMTHAVDQRVLVRASSFVLPEVVDAAVAAVFGLHGLPLPRRKALSKAAASPAAVTPAVLADTYGIKGIIPKAGDTTYRQAVAEFQGQYMNRTDLSAFFAAYVPGAKAGDDQVFKFVGAPAKDGNGVEAELDIQYLMGVSPGIATEFWEFPGGDFCADLATYTNTMLSGDDQPVVFSISYGWQGNLTRIHCTDDNLQVVDANFAKAAAKGISVLISSGDSGSGYDSSGTCSSAPGKVGVAITAGTVKQSTDGDLMECCMEGAENNAQGWTWTPPNKTELGASGDYTFKAADFHVTGVIGPSKPSKGLPVKARDVWVLDGSFTAAGGNVKLHSTNGSFADTNIVFEKQHSPLPPSQGIVRLNATASLGGTTFYALSVFLVNGGTLQQCINFEFFHDEERRAPWFIVEKGPNPPPPPPRGTCTLFSAVTAHGPSSVPGIASGGPAIEPTKPPQLWPSWPASSPWVTAVGATRFVDQTVGKPEMATDQFGSGGGFSDQFAQNPDATWQADAVAKYLSTVDPSTLPPAGSFDPKGRATPDVAALGEGYQVIVHGNVQSVGGTSASCPAFAGMVSLLNQARLAQGGKQMGFLNPWLYANADAFTSVNLGSDKFARGGGMPLAYGYNCTQGWDPATGLGTPLFPKLMAAI